MALTASPQRSSGTPITATSRTAGWTDRNVFDFNRIDVLTAADDHVLLAIDDEETLFIVEISDIAGVIPTVAQSVAGMLRLIPVTCHHARSAHDDFTNLASAKPVVIDHRQSQA